MTKFELQTARKVVEKPLLQGYAMLLFLAVITGDVYTMV